MDLFNTQDQIIPLAERMRPKRLAQFLGQIHLVSPGKILHQAVKNDALFSAIFWGPPGSGKTTLAQILAAETKVEFISVSAVTSNVSEIKKIIEAASSKQKAYGTKTVLFIDEIHRFNKAQQDVLLPHVERGTVTLIGATTENPSFEVIGPLLSRTRVLVLYPLEPADLSKIARAALSDKRGLGEKKLKIKKEALEALIAQAVGDARFVLNTLEIASQLVGPRGTIDVGDIISAMQKKMAAYDKKGDAHYDTISAFIKSMRGGKTDATLHYLARMIEAGEDSMFIARRMVIFASEDIGNAAPTALVLATSAMQAVHMVGMPEAALILAQAATYLSEAPKSIASTEAIGAALSDVQAGKLDPIPLHLRNAPTKLMKELGYGKGHVRYPWRDDPSARSTSSGLRLRGRSDSRRSSTGGREYMPKNLVGRKYYRNPKNDKF